MSARGHAPDNTTTAPMPTVRDGQPRRENPAQTSSPPLASKARARQARRRPKADAEAITPRPQIRHTKKES